MRDNSAYAYTAVETLEQTSDEFLMVNSHGFLTNQTFSTFQWPYTPPNASTSTTTMPTTIAPYPHDQPFDNTYDNYLHTPKKLPLLKRLEEIPKQLRKVSVWFIVHVCVVVTSALVIVTALVHLT